MDVRSKPELMSPAGHWPQLRAAIEAGADAVYFGLDHFSARAKVGFIVEELPEVVDALHERGVKGFVTFNTLVFDNELRRAEQAIVAIAESGADAIIVQDIGITRLAQQIVPDLDIHGSTQMSITSAQGAELAKSFGCSRVVLGRELSLADIEKISEATDVELEVFVHGALCVSYSGQCFSSEAWGGRSANRGKCAQACRLSYDLIVDGQHRELGADRYLLSPGDLYAIEQIPELIRIGVSCLKIEGRYKDEHYVALTTAAYRQAIDAAAEGAASPQRRRGATVATPDISKTQLEQIYSRGLGPHFIAGVNHQKVVQARAPRHRGLRVGIVADVKQRSVMVNAEHEIRPGDGLVFDAANWRSPDEPEEGGSVFEVHKTGDQIELRFGDKHIDFSRIHAGDLVWRTRDPQLLGQLKPLAKPKTILFARPVSMRVEGAIGRPLQVTATTEDGLTATAVSKSLLQTAEQQGLDPGMLTKQLGRLGGTPFYLESLQLNFVSDRQLFLPVSQLNELRRKLVEQLLDLRKATRRGRNVATGVVAAWFDCRQAEQPNTPETSHLHLLVRSADQLDAAIEFRPDSITLDYLELYGLRPSVEKIVAAGLVPRVASPRILKPAEQNVVRFLLSLDCAILVRSGGLLHDLLKTESDELPSLIGDFSLNAANVISASSYLELGLQVITPTYDLNARQIENLCRWVHASRLEVIAYSHLPVFHTEHCVFCRFMSSGTDHTNCGHPCESHKVALRDHSGRVHPVMADVGCRNTVFGAEAQVAPQALKQWREAGIADFRLEFVHESAEQVALVCRDFRAALAGEIGWQELARKLQSDSPAGITEGSLFVPLKT